MCEVERESKKVRERERERERDRDKEGERETERDRQTDRQTDRQINEKYKESRRMKSHEEEEIRNREVRRKGGRSGIVCAGRRDVYIIYIYI